MEHCRHKLWMYVSLEDVDVSKAKEEQLKKIVKENREIEEDVTTLRMIAEATARLHCPHKDLDDLARQMTAQLNRQLAERQNTDSQQSAYLDLCVGSSGGGGEGDTITFVFADAERRTHWEDAFNEVKQKLGRKLWVKYVAHLLLLKMSCV